MAIEPVASGKNEFCSTVNGEIDALRNRIPPKCRIKIWEGDKSGIEAVYLCFNESPSRDSIALHVREGNENGKVLKIPLDKKSLAVEGNTLIDKEHTFKFFV